MPAQGRAAVPHVVLVTRMFAPEPGAATARLNALVQGLRRRGAGVTVLTSALPRHLRTGPQATELSPPEHASKVEERPAAEGPSEGDASEGDGAASPSAPAAAEVPGGGWLRLRRWPVLRNRSGVVRGYLPYLSFDVPAAFRLLATRKIDVVVVEQPPTTGLVVSVIARLRRVPYVYYAGDIVSAALEAARVPAVVTGVVRWMERTAMRGAVSVLAVSPGVADRARALGAPRVEVVGFGVDTDVFRPDSTVERDRNLLIYAGTASEVHGAEIFLEALPGVREALPGARMLFVGSGESWPRLREMASALPEGSVEFRSAVPARTLAGLLQQSGAALASVAPQGGYEFAVATKALSALATGTPVIFAGAGPTADLVSGTGWGGSTAHDAGALGELAVTVLTGPAPPSEDMAATVRARWGASAVADRAARIVLNAPQTRTLGRQI